MSVFTVGWSPWTHELGLSAQAIAGIGAHHPHDPADLLRCINYSASRFTTAALRKRMSGRSIYRDRLLPHWDDITALLDNEMTTRTDGRAPRTYREMRRVLDDGTACATCGGTGRGTECAACKGTGRRSGGRCRATGCYEGAEPCTDCRGRGYTTETKR